MQIGNIAEYYAANYPTELVFRKWRPLPADKKQKLRADYAQRMRNRPAPSLRRQPVKPGGTGGKLDSGSKMRVPSAVLGPRMNTTVRAGSAVGRDRRKESPVESSDHEEVPTEEEEEEVKDDAMANNVDYNSWDEDEDKAEDKDEGNEPEESWKKSPEMDDVPDYRPKSRGAGMNAKGSDDVEKPSSPDKDPQSETRTTPAPGMWVGGGGYDKSESGGADHEQPSSDWDSDDDGDMHFKIEYMCIQRRANPEGMRKNDLL